MILGIDLGTSNSMAAVYRDGKVDFIPSRTGSKIIPSVVGMDENGLFYAGEVAKERKLKYPHMTVDLFKRSMGTKKTFTIGDKEIMAEELSAIVLKSIKEDAETYLGESVTEAIISVPAFFNNAQRKSVLQAGKLAGLEVKKIINEPTAAALAYGVDGTSKGIFEEKIILVLDLGGGTFDISVMEAGEDVMEVVAVCGDNKLGGSDFTARLISLFQEAHQIKEITDLEEKSILWEQAEKAKKQLSTTGVGTITCNIGGRPYEYSITEAEYEVACFDLLERIRKLTVKAVEESKYKPEEIEEIIMVGGGTKLSIVKKLIERIAGKALSYPIDPDEAVATGAAMQGAMFEKKEAIKDLVMTDIAPHYLGTITSAGGQHDLNEEFEMIIPKNATIPSKGKLIHYPRPARWLFTIYQSEDQYGEHRNYIGGLNYIAPDLGTSERVEVHKIVYYDVNGIVHLAVHIPDTGVTFEDTIVDENSELSLEEAWERLQKLKYLELGDREQNENQLLIARADNLYMELDIRTREQLSNIISEFEGVLNGGKRSDIIKMRQELKRFLELNQVLEY